MRKFSLNSDYFENLSFLATSLNKYKNDVFSIVVNNSIFIQLQEIVAASLSTEVLNLLKVDPTTKELRITIESDSDLSPIFDKIKRCVVFHESVDLENDEEKRIFGKFGLLIGNKDFSNLLVEYLERERKSISCENVVSLIKFSIDSGIQDISNETSFIAKNFDKMSTNPDFIKFSLNTFNFNIVESIINSNDLKLVTEDTLLKYVLRIIKESNNNTMYFRLLDYVLLQYCSPAVCEEFMSFFVSSSPTDDFKSVISCAGRRLLNGNLIMNPCFAEGRHVGLEIINKNQMKGIFSHEHERNNVVMEASTTNNGNVYTLLEEEKRADFSTMSEENSYVKASFKDNKAFQIKSYTIRGSACSGLSDPDNLKTWCLYGEDASTGQWVPIDRHTNDEIGRLQVRTFPITNNNKYKSVKLVIEGETSQNQYYLEISAFDVSGYLFN